MKRFFLLSALSGFAVAANAAPTVSQLSATYVSHSDLQLNFHVDGASHLENATSVVWDYFRMRYTTDGSSCSGGTGGIVQGSGYGHFDGHTASARMGGEQGSSTGTGRIILSGVIRPANGIIHVCPEVAVDDNVSIAQGGLGSGGNGASSWSTGAELIVTLPAQTGVHPNYPVLPSITSAPTRPDTTTTPTNWTRVSSSCATIVNDFRTAVANSLTKGQIIELPAGATCNANIYPNANWPDVSQYTNSIFTNNAGLMTVTYANSYAEAQALVFSNWYDGLPNEPTASCDGVNYGHVYYVHFPSGPSSSFQLTCDAPYAQGGTVMSYVNRGGSARVMVAKYPRAVNWVIIRSSTPEAQAPAPNTRVGPEWAPKFATLQHAVNTTQPTFTTTDIQDGNIKYLATKVWIENIRFLAANNTSIDANNPPEDKNFIAMGPDSSNIVISQNLIQGLGYPNRLYTISFDYDGMNNGYVNNYFSDLTDWSYGEGTQAFVAQKGPGPLFFVGNKLERYAGNILHFSDDGGPNRVRGDELVSRNLFKQDFSLCLNLIPGGNSTIDYGGRQPVEWKAGHRILMEGNIFDQNWFHHASSVVVFTSVEYHGSGITDVTYRYNTIKHSFGGVIMGDSTQGANFQTAPDNRFDFHDNIFYDIKGYYAASNANTGAFMASPNSSRREYAGMVVQSLGDGEDQRFNHNTIFDVDGSVGNIIRGGSYAEGVELKDNILFIDSVLGGGGINLNHGFSSESGGPVVDGIDPCHSSVGQAFLTCHYRNIDIANNVLLSDAYSASTLSGGGTNTAWFPGSGWIIPTDPTSPGQIGWRKSTTPQLLNFAYPSVDFELKNISNYVSGSTGPNAHRASDGKDIGADLLALQAAQGKVTYNGTSGITTTSMNVNFIAPDGQACPVDLSTTDSTLVNSFTRYTDSGSARVRSVAITGLTPHTAYYGRVNCQVEQPTFVVRTR
jgi:hypothetical protein